jgi:CRP/FNR family cyclic AMP-dependent transcriptional regulator
MLSGPCVLHFPSMQWPLLGSLSAEDRTLLLTTARRRRFIRGEVVFREGDPGDSLHLIESGHLAIQVSTPGGETATLNVLSPGGFFGGLALLRRKPTARRTATVVALEPAQTLSVSGTAFQAICAQHPGVERLVVTMLAQRVDELSARLLEALYLGVDRRVYRRLVELADIYRGDSPAVVIPLSQDDLAGMAGASRPTVNQVLQKLASRRIMALGRRQIEVLNYDALHAYAPDHDD